MKTPEKKRKIRYAVVGLGYITQTAILPAFEHAKKNSELVALISSDEHKLQVLSKKYKVPVTATYPEYEDCLLKNNIDAVFIALPNHLHRQFAERAAEMGIHVLCEKPMALTKEDCVAMIEASRKNRVKLMIAYRLHFDKANLKCIEEIQNNTLGNLRFFQASFSMQVSKNNIRLNPVSLGGGPMYDLGIYCINAARYLFQDEPLEVFAFSATDRTDSRFAKIPEMISVALRFPKERLASFTTSFGAAGTSVFEIVGTEGSLRLDNAFDYAHTMKSTITLGSKIKTKTYEKHDQFAPELIYFSNCILDNIEPEPSGLEGFLDIQIIEAIHLSCKTGKPVLLSEVKKNYRPTIEQKIHRPAVQKPKLVHAKPAAIH